MTREYCFIVSIKYASQGDEVLQHIDGTVNIKPGMTRLEAQRFVIKEVAEKLGVTNFALLFFSLEPNDVLVPGRNKDYLLGDDTMPAPRSQ